MHEQAVLAIGSDRVNGTGMHKVDICRAPEQSLKCITFIAIVCSPNIVQCLATECLESL